MCPHHASERDGGFDCNRRAGDFAIVSVATTLELGHNGGIHQLRLAVGGIGPVPVRVEDLVTADISGKLLEGWSAGVAAAVAGAVEIEDNERTPVEFRRELVATLMRDALDQALKRAR
jgi:carbon-monoxide dehydrogenase medium subunit